MARNSASLDSSSHYIPHQFIVVFNDQANGIISKNAAMQATQLTNSLLATYNISDKSVKNRYEYALKGFTAKLSDEQLKALKQDPRIDYIVQDHTFPTIYPNAKANSYSALSNSNLSPASQTITWNIARVNGPINGTGKKAWIIGGGIDLQSSISYNS